MSKTIADIQFITPDISDVSILKHIVRSVCDAGCRWVQLRLKNTTDDEFLKMAQTIKPLVKEYDARLIINDKVEIAQKIGADGVHLGKNDMPPAQAREILGTAVIIGATADDIQTVKKHLSDDAVDYIGLGPYRFTTTKKNLSPVLGLEGYKGILSELNYIKLKPIVAVGGITYQDIIPLKEIGLYGVAVSSDMVKNPTCYAEFFKYQ